MVKRFHDQVFNKMTPERRARNLYVMKTLAQTSVELKNKENANSLNNNSTLTFNIMKHSTPLKFPQVTDLDSLEPISATETEYYASEEEDSFGPDCNREDNEPKLVIAKIYDLIPKSEKVNADNNYKEPSVQNNSDFEVVVPQRTKSGELRTSRKEETVWKSLSVLDETAEYEFCKSLEQSKLYLSTSNLLEEIEADLPSRYSLAKPLNHTFHSLESYRTVIRLARMDKNFTCTDTQENGYITDCEILSKRMEGLEKEAMVQKTRTKQAAKALAFSKGKKSLEVENFESEKSLLLANLRLNAAVQQIENLKLRAKVNTQENFGKITIRNIKFSIDNAMKNVSEKFICTATEKENVQFSGGEKRTTCGKLVFDTPMEFENLEKDFVITIQLFKRNNPEVKTSMRICLMKKLRELAGGSLQKSITNSPGLNHGFRCVASAQFKLEQIAKRENEECNICFAEPPLVPVKGESLSMNLKTVFNIKMKKVGFLNVFKQTWQRCWFSQSEYFLNSWLYPEDQENNKPPINSIYLPDCHEKVRVADLEVCIRPHSFIITCEPNNEEILFSADSNKDMTKWMNHLNLIIEHIHLWKPTL